MDKKTVSKILAFVEKNCTEIEEVEEYLWKSLDKGIDDERVTKGVGFTITCNECGSKQCRIETNTNYEYIEVNLICDDCGNIF